jgi:DNA helicase-2/ATP-dependent DNA helicase PcrA
MEDRRQWPPPARVGVDDELFSNGWGSAADAVVAGEMSVESLLETLSPEERATAEQSMEANSRDLAVIAAAARPDLAPEPEVPPILSATSYIRLANGELTAWDLARPLPERPTTARRIGTEVHRLIEERSRGMSPFPDEHELDEPGKYAHPSRISQLMKRWEELGYSDRTIARLPSGEPMIELPFALKKEGRIIRGRIDAVYETDDGGLEIVDFKTGRPVEHGKPGDQLDVYADALRSIRPDVRDVRLTYAALGQ